MVFSSIGIAAFVGCNADGEFSGDLTSDPPAETGANLPPPSGGSSGQIPKDAGKDAKLEASVDAGPPPPEPGTVCAKIDQIFQRPCGACGITEAICVAGADGGAGTVSEYGACLKEVAGGCIPGSTATESCGNCGTLTKTCTKYCAWQKPACSGEPVGSCPAGTVAWSTAGCPTGVTERTCNDTCTWSSFTGVCKSADFAVRVSGVPGKSQSIILPLVATTKTKKVSGSCASGVTLSDTDQHVTAYVRVQNDNAQTAKISAWNAQAPGGSVIDTILTSYGSIPTNEAELRACEKGAGDTCNTTQLPCGDAKFGALTGTNVLSIPPGQARVIAITTSATHGSGNTVEGPITLTVRTDALE